MNAVFIMSETQHQAQSVDEGSESSPGETVTVEYKGRSSYFDMAGVNVEKPGVINGALLKGRFYEARFLDYIASLKIRGTYLDVGSCVGTHSVFFAMFCPSDHVYAFEPRDLPRARTERNLALNGLLDKVTVSHWALSDERGKVTVELDRREHTFETERLDHVVQGRVALIKLDVEGMEPRVLAGAAGILRKSRPRVFAEAHTDEAFEQVLEQLRPYGYEATGRVFNASPTYEFAVPPSRWVRLRRRLVRRSRALTSLARTIRRRQSAGG